MSLTTIEGAVLVIETAHKRRTSEQVAAWYTEVELRPGEYPIESAGPLPYFRSARVPGVIVDEHFPSMFGGVAYGPGRKDGIGEETVYWVHLPDKCEEDGEYGANGRVRFNVHNQGKARIELRRVEVAA